MIRRFLILLLLLAPWLPSFGDDARPVKSILLVARKNLPDPFFRDSVVLVTNRGAPVPVGFIVNRPTRSPLADVFPDIGRLRKREDKLFFGGPVSHAELVAVFRSPAAPKDAVEVLDGIYMSASREVLRGLLDRDPPVDGLRVYAGHAAWAPGQLEAEIARGDWHLLHADARTVFETKPESLWRELERRASAVVARN